LFLPPGHYRLDLAMKVDSNPGNEDVADLLVGCLSPPTKLANRVVRGNDFSTTGCWSVHQVTFAVPEDIEHVQIGIVSTGKTPISVDYLDLIAEPQDPPSERK
jgi:hypothetical protein